MSNTIFTPIKYTSNQLYINGLFTCTISANLCNHIAFFTQTPSKIVLVDASVAI